MDNQTLAHQIGQAGGKLMRLELDLGRAQRSLEGAIRNRAVGGVVAVIGMMSLIGFLVLRSQFTGAIAAAGLFIGGLVLIMALKRIGGIRRSIVTTTSGIANARAKLAELKAQPSTAE